MAIRGGTGIATENQENMTFFKRFSFGGDVWQYVAIPVSLRKTKKVTFFKLFSFGGDVWQYVAIPDRHRN